MGRRVQTKLTPGWLFPTGAVTAHAAQGSGDETGSEQRHQLLVMCGGAHGTRPRNPGHPKVQRHRSADPGATSALGSATKAAPECVFTRLPSLEPSLWGPSWPQAGTEGGEPVFPVRAEPVKDSGGRQAHPSDSFPLGKQTLSWNTYANVSSCCTVLHLAGSLRPAPSAYHALHLSAKHCGQASLRRGRVSGKGSQFEDKGTPLSRGPSRTSLQRSSGRGSAGGRTLSWKQRSCTEVPHDGQRPRVENQGPPSPPPKKKLPVLSHLTLA